MKILMLAPEPFLAPRGTPLSIYFRINALSELGHKVDLITYHLGKNVQLKNVAIYRIPRFLFISRVKIGASLAKMLLDLLLLFKAIIRLSKKKYDLIYSHEEAALIGAALTKIWRLSHVYDMHSSLPQHMESSMFLGSGVLTKIFSWIEHLILKSSQAVVVICPELLKRVRKKGFGAKSILLENFLEYETLPISKEQTRKIRERLAPCQEKIVLYTGNFQPYQGIDLLLKAADKTEDKNISFVLVGGAEQEIETMRKKAESLHISAKVHFEGEVPPSQIPLFLSSADALVSPRLHGPATPLKIYSYLRSGKPLVATNLPVHTQILDKRISILVSPDARSLVKGITFALFDPQARRRAQAARQWMESHYPPSLYLKKMDEILKTAKRVLNER